MKKSTIKPAEKRPNKALSARINTFDPASTPSAAGSGPTTRKYSPKQIVFRQGTAASAIYYIQTGKVQLSVVSKQGKEAITAHLGDGEFFGEGCLAGQPFY